MDLSKCMLRECKVCKNRIKCFKENEHEYSKDRYEKSRNNIKKFKSK